MSWYVKLYLTVHSYAFVFFVNTILSYKKSVIFFKINSTLNRFSNSGVNFLRILLIGYKTFELLIMDKRQFVIVWIMLNNAMM